MARLKLVVALGGNALLKRSDSADIETQRRNARQAAMALMPVIRDHDVVLTHGNGPQVGLLALQATPTPLDVLTAESEGLIGYLLQQELAAVIEREVATLLTTVEVAADDPAFAHPEKPIGRVVTRDEAAIQSSDHGWVFVPEGGGLRRVVASPAPRVIREIAAIRSLMAAGILVICAGGGGIPVMQRDGEWVGAPAVVDKDRTAALLARALGADGLIMLTDVPAVFADWPERARPIALARADELDPARFAAGSMAPKIAAACDVARAGGFAAIGALTDAGAVIAGRAGTRIVR